jgi:hypothetical protein
MMRNLLLLAALVVLAIPVSAAPLERELKNRWLGAWVIVSVESYSDCQGQFTNNRINQSLVKSKGRHEFPAGELAKVHKIDAKRSRVDVLMVLEEPLLVSYGEGPFTLYREAQCKIEFEVELPREIVKDKSADSVDERLSLVLERYANQEEATASTSWNRREIEPYPDDYDRTLAELAVWRAEQSNAGVQAQLDRAYEEIDRLADRLDSDPIYLNGFAEGVEYAKAHALHGCPALLSFDLDDLRPHSPGYSTPDETDQTRSDRGNRDGRLLVYSLEMVRRLPACFIPVPDLLPEE